MPTPLEILQQHWGHAAFRPLQSDIIEAVLAGRDALALLPTGGGKSLCFQVPALYREGLCLVISPLIALMRDQVDNLKKRGIPAAAVYSGMSRRELDIVFENACNGAYKLLYLSPERLKTDLALARIARMNVNLLAVDEAHCISQWGYDFRPSYLQIAEIRARLPKTPLLALTATATPEVVEDIQKRLDFRAGAQVFQQSFARTNLSYSVLYEQNKREKVLDILRNVPGTGIVYVRSRGDAKEVAQLLQANRISADFYHAGLLPDERTARQTAWTTGKTRVMVSTNAFGMGIDKPDVRTVVHLGLPDSLEAYFQEAGRGGRDGQKSYAVLLFTPADADSLRFHLQAAFPDLEEVRRVYRALGSHTQVAVGAGAGETYDFDFQHFCTVFKLEHAHAHAALRLLEQEGWLALTEAGNSPAQAFVKASREAIYDYQLRSKTADALIKAMLRMYPGIQREAADISEMNIAHTAKLPLETVVALLENLQKEELLDYFPRRDKPQMTFLRERVAAENLTIDLEKFNFRKKRAEERVEKAIRYAETRRCRSQQLLAYFGEKDAPACGICDVCTGRNRAEIPVGDFENYARKIRELLQKEALSFEQILEAFPQKRHDTVAKTVAYLEDEGRLQADEAGLLRWSN